jgi:predicted RNA-binding protein with PUA domain
MLNLDLRKIYKFVPVTPVPDPAKLPVGAMYYYECQDCEGIVSSVPLVASKCPCGNLCGNGGKLEVRDPARLRVMTGKLK